MIIRLPIRFEGSVGEKTLYGLFDTGATFSCIHPDYAEAISEPQRLFRPLEIETADKGRYMKITEAIRTDFYINDIRMSDEFYIVPNLSEETIIGVTTMQKWRIKLDFEHDTVIIDPKTAKAILKELK
jgi:predicted aspartyl protease